MKKSKNISFWLIIMVSYASVYSQTQIKNIDFTNLLNEVNDFSGVVLIAQNHVIIEHRAYGLANIENDVPNDLDTRFNIASITKMITSSAILKLHEEGKIDFHKTVGHYLPDFPNFVIRDSVTLHQLLTHTSGIKPFYGQKYLDSNKVNYRKVADFLHLFVDEPLLFSPGKGYKYSGSGFVILGLIIERISGIDYYDFIEKEIFEPAGMKGAVAAPTDTILLNKASGYTSIFGDLPYYKTNEYYISKASPAGSHYATAKDLFLFADALYNGKLINISNFDLMKTPWTKGMNTHIGYGMDVDQRNEELIIGHSGGWFGVRGELMIFPQSGYVIVVLSNKDDNGKTGASKLISDLKAMISAPK